MRIGFPLMAAAYLCLGTAHADRVDKVVRQELKAQSIPGIGIAIIRDGRIVKEQGYGLANIEHGVPVTPATVFQSGSIGKQFTAALVMLLVEDGKLGLDDLISTHLSVPPHWGKITVRHLLTHTAGISDEPVDHIDLHRDYSDEQLLQLAGAVPLLSEPGEKWSYSNSGYQVLGFLCNKLGGSHYAEQLQTRLFKPLGMATRLISERDIVPHRAAGYDIVEGAAKNQDWVSPTLNATADGSLYLTARDLARWDIALNGDKPLSAASKQAGWTPVKLNDGSSAPYGFAWSVLELKGHRVVEHDGAWQGFTTQISRFPDDKLTVIVLTNRSDADVAKIVYRIAAVYVPGLGR
ncbi:beta-lactamase family protein [Chitinimonas arctica]|uniref:Beta-lactamase family protein n=1 Tax=Chitinimonas arctica TaxID=2594795 RepID=A0A516SL03_9NEIS|nr:serine hydrolase domain-containing protein [Chitinimonas arctica]QDQ28803.1 beta-lactamase family protein [Chitinimonas arctica]